MRSVVIVIVYIVIIIIFVIIIIIIFVITRIIVVIVIFSVIFSAIFVIVFAITFVFIIFMVILVLFSCCGGSCDPIRAIERRIECSSVAESFWRVSNNSRQCLLKVRGSSYPNPVTTVQ